MVASQVEHWLDTPTRSAPVSTHLEHADRFAEPARRAHRDWYARLAERAEAEMAGARQKHVFDQLEAEHDNLRAAIGWSLF